MKSLPQSKINEILFLLDHGLSATRIASEAVVGIATVSRIRKKYRPNIPIPPPGRPSLLTEHDIRHACHLITSGRADTAVEVTQELRDITNKPLSTETVRRALRSAGFKATVKKKKPRLTKKQRKDRLDFAVAHQFWTPDDWKCIVWSDEAKINRFQSDGRSWTWKPKGQGLIDREVTETLKFGGGRIMIWGCMLWEGKGDMCKIDSTMDKDLYVEILEENLMGTLKDYGKTPATVIFMHDNDPKHTSHKARDWLKDHGFTVLLWPANSPDLNPIEHLWNYIKRKLKEYPEPPKGILELWERVQDEWNKIPAEECKNLIRSMSSRMEAVIRAKGGHIKY